jgi:hypothetical protein
LAAIKVEPAIAKERQEVQAIRVYPSKLMKEIDSSIERGEQPVLMLKKEFSKTRKVDEFSFVFLGPYHIENIDHPQKDPSTWNSFGEIYMTIPQALQLARRIIRIANAKAGQMELQIIRNMVVSAGWLSRFKSRHVQHPGEKRCERTGHGRGKRRRKRE